jgi:hypothetical protein
VNLTGFSIVNSTIINSFTDATATITYPSSTSIKMFTGSPVWVKVTTTTTNPYNIMNFHYAFESASGSQGMFSVSVDNQVVDILDERIATSGDETDVFIGNLAPGPHTFAFRLDPYTNVQSVLELSNMQLGYLEETTSTYTPPPIISSFSASSSILSWDVSNASSVTIMPGSFSTSTLVGSLIVDPTSTTVYTLTATNASGTATATTTINVSSNWYSVSWLHRKPITINHDEVSPVASTTLTNFPVLINIASDTELSSFATSSGNDILFTAEDGITLLNYEIESYSSSTGALIAWVNIPSLSAASDTQIYMYFGNAGATSSLQNASGTWDSNYVGVYHLPDGTTLSSNDSTENENNGIILKGGTLPTATMGYISGGAVVGSTTRGIAAIGSLDITGQITMEAWVKFNAFPAEGSYATQAIVGKGSSYATYAGYYLDLENDGGPFEDLIAGTVASGTKYNADYRFASSSLIIPGTWHHYVGTYDGSDWNLYLDGMLIATAASSNGAQADPTDVMLIGTDGSNGGFPFPTDGMNGAVDEVRLSNIARSPDWIGTEYNNESNIDTFETVGAGQVSGIFPSISSFSASSTIVAPAGTSTLSWNAANASSIVITPGSFSTSTRIGWMTVNPTSTTVYTLTATNVSGISTATTAVTVDATPPSAPESLVVTTSSISAISLSWSSSTDTGGSALVGYIVYRGTSASSMLEVATTTNLTYVDSGLSASTTYYYAVAAYDGVGNTSMQATSTSGTTLSGGSDAWYSTSWSFRKLITINHDKVSPISNTALVNFPVLVSISSDTNLSANALALGDDILFTAGDGVTLLNYQIESYASSTGRLTAWVNIPSLSATSDTQIYMYFDNPSLISSLQNVNSTWDSDYVGVYHFMNNGTFAVYDSTADGNHPRFNWGGTYPAAVPGFIDEGVSIASTTYGITIGEPTGTIDITGPITMEAWVKMNAFPFSGTYAEQSILSKGYYQAPDAGYYFDFYDDSINTGLIAGTTVNGTRYNAAYDFRHIDTSSPITIGTWHDYVGTYDGSRWNIYLDGALVATSTSANGAQADATDTLLLGTDSSDGVIFPTDGLNGVLSEIRLSSIARSPDWIATEYNNDATPGTFETVGAAEVIR